MRKKGNDAIFVNLTRNKAFSFRFVSENFSHSHPSAIKRSHRVDRGKGLEIPRKKITKNIATRRAERASKKRRKNRKIFFSEDKNRVSRCNFRRRRLIRMAGATAGHNSSSTARGLAKGDERHVGHHRGPVLCTLYMKTWFIISRKFSSNPRVMKAKFRREFA